MLLRSRFRRNGRPSDERASLGLHWVLQFNTYRRPGFDCFLGSGVMAVTYLDKQEIPMDNLSMTIFDKQLDK